MEIKICTKCKLELTLDDFYPDTRHKDGKQSSCKTCVKETNRNWKSKNKDRISTYNRQYQAPKVVSNENTAISVECLARVKRHWNGKCALCRIPVQTFGLVLPEKFDGIWSMYNIIPECMECHNKKKDTDIFFFSILTGINIGDVLTWAANSIDLIKKLSVVRERYYSHSFKPQMKMALLKAINLQKIQCPQ